MAIDTQDPLLVSRTARERLRDGALFIVLYLALDWLSFVHPVGGFGITPWNPQIGLSVAFILWKGAPIAPAVLLAPVIADLLARAAEVPPALSIALSVTSGTSYLFAWLIVRRFAFADGFSVERLRDLVTFFAVSFFASALVAIALMGWYLGFGLVQRSQLSDALMRQWIGDLIGIALMVPLVFLIVDRRPLPPPRPGLLVHAVLLLAALFLVFGLDQPSRTTLFYILFLPVVAIAASYGFEAVVLALAATQIALILADQVWKMSSFEVTTLQGFLLVLSATGMTAGLLVSQRKHAEMLLRQQQEQQARLQQRGSLGELATLIAHEVNQPLTAASMYARMIVEAVARDMPSSQLETLAQKSAQQVTRASAVVRKLRELVRMGRSARAACAVAEIVDESVSLFLQTAGSMTDIAVQVQVASGLPPVLADRTQVEQVLLNLLRNAVEAIRSRPGGGKVQITARRTADDRVDIVVADDGPGFPVPPETLIDGLKSTKSEGLGVGLALSRTIVELHNGDFEIITTSQGASVRFTLPIVRQPEGAP